MYVCGACCCCRYNFHSKSPCPMKATFDIVLVRGTTGRPPIFYVSGNLISLNIAELYTCITIVCRIRLWLMTTGQAPLDAYKTQSVHMGQYTHYSRQTWQFIVINARIEAFLHIKIIQIGPVCYSLYPQTDHPYPNYYIVRCTILLPTPHCM